MGFSIDENWWFRSWIGKAEDSKKRESEWKKGRERELGNLKGQVELIWGVVVSCG